MGVQEFGNNYPRKRGSVSPCTDGRCLSIVSSFWTKPWPKRGIMPTHPGRNVYATVKPSGICVDIRQHWLPPNQTEVVPNKKGLTLRPSEYAKIKDVFSVIGDFVPGLNSIVPCPYRSDHMNQLGFFSCSECNPDHCVDW